VNRHWDRNGQRIIFHPNAVAAIRRENHFVVRMMAND
jgi:hypothetical protein